VLFFFALGAGFQIGSLAGIAIPAILLALIAVVLKPWLFRWLLQREQEKAKMAAETGARLGQISEFSLLIVVVATKLAVMSERAALLLQAAAIFSFVLSSFWIVRRYPTPIATDRSLRRD